MPLKYTGLRNFGEELIRFFFLQLPLLLAGYFFLLISIPEYYLNNKYPEDSVRKIKHKKYLIQHEKNCTGVDSLTCPKCMKTFSDRKIKHRHCKNDTCKPASIYEAENIKGIINKINSLNTKDIYIKDYGKERKDYLIHLC